MIVNECFRWYSEATVTYSHFWQGIKFEAVDSPSIISSNYKLLESCRIM